MSEAGEDSRHAIGLTIVETVAAVAAAAITVALVWGLPARLLVGGIALGLAGGIAISYLHVRSRDRQAARFAILGFPGLPIGAGIVVSFSLLIVPLGIPPAQAHVASPSSTATPTQPVTGTPTPTITPEVPPTSTNSPTPTASNASTVQLADKVRLSVSRVDTNSSPATVSLTVQNDSNDTYVFSARGADLTVTDDVHSVYQSVWLQDDKSGLICRDAVCNTNVNSGLFYTVDVKISDALSPKATILIVKFTAISRLNSVVLQATIPR